MSEHNDAPGPPPRARGELQARLDAANNANRALLETLSHDLRTPLNTIIGFADMMEQQMLGPIDNPHYRSYAADINQSGRQMLEMLNDLLDRQRFEQFEKSESDFRHMFELAPDLISICKDGEILRINPAGANLLGVWPTEALIGRQFSEFVDSGFQPLIAEGLEKLTDRTTRLPLKLSRTDSISIDVEIAAIPYNAVDPEPATDGAVLLIARDVTERNRAVSQVASREKHIRKIMDTVVEGILSFNTDGIIATINPAAERLFGFDAGELIGCNVIDLVTGEDFVEFAFCTDKANDRGFKEFRATRKDGAQVFVEFSVSPMSEHGRTTFIGAIHDITDRKMVEARLVELATLEPLTQLPNRTAFREHLKQAIDRSRLDGVTIAVLFVDLDNFRHINDTQGHVIGDQVICMVGERIRHCLRDRDVVAHMGGDEFMVLLNGVSGDEETLAAGEIILEVIEQPFFLETREIFATASIGVALFPTDGNTPGELLKNVDTALHNIKRRDRGALQFYSPELTVNLGRRVDLEAGLRQAMDNGEFSLMFQPKIDLATHRIVGAEALVRWESRDLGPVSPAEFVPVAEESGMIGDIGDWVMEQACREAALWNENATTRVHVGVNVSAHQMRGGDISEKVKSNLEQSGLDPRLLELELTESVMMDDTGRTISALEDLRQLGISVAIDDFGTGYSSLSYLTDFPLDTLKVDRAFVMNLPDDRDAVAIARAIIGMANSLNLHIVAEGIETHNQEGFLHALGCHTGQGYLFSRPVSVSAFNKLINSNVVEIGLSV